MIGNLTLGLALTVVFLPLTTGTKTRIPAQTFIRVEREGLMGAGFRHLHKTSWYIICAAFELREKVESPRILSRSCGGFHVRLPTLACILLVVATVSPLPAATPAPPVRPYLALGDSVSFGLSLEPALSMSTRTISSGFQIMLAWRSTSSPRMPRVRVKRPAVFCRQLQRTMVVEPSAPGSASCRLHPHTKLISPLLSSRRIQTPN
jgi:hypothetical protein